MRDEVGQLEPGDVIRLGLHLQLPTGQCLLELLGLDEIRSIGRNTQGVRLIKLKSGDKLVAAARIAPEEI